MNHSAWLIYIMFWWKNISLKNNILKKKKKIKMESKNLFILIESNCAHSCLNSLIVFFSFFFFATKITFLIWVSVFPLLTHKKKKMCYELEISKISTWIQHTHTHNTYSNRVFDLKIPSNLCLFFSFLLLLHIVLKSSAS